MNNSAMTVLGPVSTDNLGVTSMHDHMMIGFHGWEQNPEYTYDSEAVLEACVKKVNEAKKLGLQTIVDATPCDLGRKPELLRDVQRATGVNIICSSGFYTEAQGHAVYWRNMLTDSGYSTALERMTDLFVRELTVGIDDTDIKSGVLKIATSSEDICGTEELVLDAAVRAQEKTGTPIISHTEVSSMGPAQAGMLQEKGADPGRTMVGHMCDTEDIDCLEEILKRGFYLGMDRFGIDFIFPDEKKCKTVVKLIQKGYGKKILLGHDYIVHVLGGTEMPPSDTWSFSGLLKVFLPRMRELGLTDDDVKMLMIDNPRRFFNGET